MATCARCGDEIPDTNADVSESALLMVLIADHMLELFGLARWKRKSSSDERTFAIESDLQSWNAFAHFGRILSKGVHDAAHNGDQVFDLSERWLDVATRFGLIGMDRTPTGQVLRGKVPVDGFVPQEDSILATQLSQANMNIQGWR
jgi:hypothetical protein